MQACVDTIGALNGRVAGADQVEFTGGGGGGVGEEPDTIEEVYEPYLIMKGYLNRTP